MKVTVPLITKPQLNLIDLLCSKLGNTSEAMLVSYSKQLWKKDIRSPHSLSLFEAKDFIKFLQRFLDE